MSARAIPPGYALVYPRDLNLNVYAYSTLFRRVPRPRSVRRSGLLKDALKPERHLLRYNQGVGHDDIQKYRRYGTSTWKDNSAYHDQMSALPQRRPGPLSRLERCDGCRRLHGVRRRSAQPGPQGRACQHPQARCLTCVLPFEQRLPFAASRRIA